MTEVGGIRLEMLSRRECLLRLASVPIGRIGVSVDALPVVLPVNFLLVDEDIVFRTVIGTKFDAATSGAVVAFEIDGWEHDGTSGWSVLVQGQAVPIRDEADLARMSGLAITSWALDGNADRFVRISPTSITGRSFTKPSVERSP